MSTKVLEANRFAKTSLDGIFKDTRSGRLYLRDTLYDKDNNPHYYDKSLKTDKITHAHELVKQIRARLARGEEVKATHHFFADAFDLVIKIQSGHDKAEKTDEQARGIIDPHLRPWFLANCPTLTGPCKRYPDGFVKQYEEVWSDFKTEASGRKPPKYLTVYTNKAAGEIDHDATERRTTDWLAAHPSPRKLEHDRRYLVMTLIRAHKRGWIPKLFEKEDFDLLEVGDTIGRYIEDEDVTKLLEAARPYPKLYLQVRMALQLGMRLREILHLSKEEVDLKAREIDLNPKRIKTRQRRKVRVPIPDDLIHLIKAAHQAAQGAYLFPAVMHYLPGSPTDWTKPQNDNSYHWDKIRELTKIDARFHDLRHTAITNLIIAGVPESSIMKICGVSEITMRRIYAHIESKLKNKFKEALQGKYA